jgi:hypothetical protein
MREGILKAGVHLRGGWRWAYHSGRENSISYEVNTLDQACPLVRLFYTITHPATKERESLDYRVELTTTRPRYGGLRPFALRLRRTFFWENDSAPITHARV